MKDPILPIVSFELAKIAYQKGFPQERSLREHYYNYLGELDGNVLEFIFSKGNEKYKFITAPFQQVLQNWISVNFNIEISIIPKFSDSKRIGWYSKIYVLDNEHNIISKHGDDKMLFDTAIEAMEVSLIAAMKLI